MPVRVVDASVGVKWFRNEPGSDEARALVEDHIAGTALIAVDTLFLYEVLRAASRDGEPADPVRVWHDLERLDLVVVPPGAQLVSAAADARSELGCTLSDAVAPALADLLSAPLYSADRRAHNAHPRAVIIGP
jgi:predicted nucleic acid-binding protein